MPIWVRLGWWWWASLQIVVHIIHPSEWRKWFYCADASLCPASWLHFLWDHFWFIHRNLTVSHAEGFEPDVSQNPHSSSGHRKINDDNIDSHELEDSNKGTPYSRKLVLRGFITHDPKIIRGMFISALTTSTFSDNYYYFDPWFFKLLFPIFYSPCFSQHKCGL